MNWITSLFKRKTPFQIGNVTLPSLGFIAIVDSRNCENFSRFTFLEKAAKKAYKSGLANHKKPNHISYWYDGPQGNQSLRIYESGAAEKVQKEIIGFSRLILGESGSYETAIKLSEDLMKNNNGVFLLLESPLSKEWNHCELELYKGLFPEALLIQLDDMR